MPSIISERCSQPLLLVVLISMLTLSGCGSRELELKSFDYLGVGAGKASAILPRKASKSSIVIVDEKATTQADLQAFEVKVVLKKGDENFGFTDYVGYFYPSASATPKENYAVYHRKINQQFPAAALNQARNELFEYYSANFISEKGILLEGKYQGTDVNFTIPAGADLPKRSGILRIVHVPQERNRRTEYRIFVIQAIGSGEFLASPRTQQILNSLKIGG